jgi:alkylation response protein AidB-like acyl-CoA dehydrogenase
VNNTVFFICTVFIYDFYEHAECRRYECKCANVQVYGGAGVCQDAPLASGVTVNAFYLTSYLISSLLQVYGGAGVCQDTPLAVLYAGARTLRLADGPDEVHRELIAREELRRSKL